MKKIILSIPQTGFMRVKQIIGDKKTDPPTPPLVPVSAATWWSKVKSGEYPQPVKISENCTAWRVEDILDLIEKLSKGEQK